MSFRNRESSADGYKNPSDTRRNILCALGGIATGVGAFARTALYTYNEASIKQITEKRVIASTTEQMNTDDPARVIMTAIQEMEQRRGFSYPIDQKDIAKESSELEEEFLVQAGQKSSLRSKDVVQVMLLADMWGTFSIKADVQTGTNSQTEFGMNSVFTTVDTIINPR